MLRAQALPVIVWAHTAERHLDPLPVVPIHVFGELRLQLGRRSPLPAGPVVHLDLERSGELLVGGVVRAARLPRHRPRQAMPVHEANPTAPAATHSPVGAGDRVSSLGQRVGSCAGLLFGISPRPPSAMQITSQLQTEPADFAPRSAATGLGSSPLVTRRAASGFKIRRAEPPLFLSWSRHLLSADNRLSRRCLVENPSLSTTCCWVVLPSKNSSTALGLFSSACLLTSDSLRLICSRNRLYSLTLE